MALVFADLVREFSSSAGAGDFVLGGAVQGHRRFGEAVPAGARFHYCIAGVTRPEEWETGEGEIGSGGSLVRGAIASSAGDGALVDFSAGLKTVTLTVGAEWFAAREAGVAVADVAGLEAALGGKAAAAHDHDGRYAPAAHDHDGVYQPLDAELSAIGGLSGAADRVVYFTGPGAAALTPFTSFGRGLAGSTDAAAGQAALGLGGAAVKAVGTAGDAVPVLGGGATSWAAGASFGGPVAAAGISSTARTDVASTVRATGHSDAPAGAGAEMLYVGGEALFLGFDRGTGTWRPVRVMGSSVKLDVDGVTVASLDAGGLQVTGQLRGDSLRIDAAPAAGGGSATHRLPVSLNGVTYHLLLSEAA